MTIILWKTQFKWSRIHTVQTKRALLKFNNPAKGNLGGIQIWQ